MDRLISPLLDRERVVIFVGDHGESFGEDGYFLHCSALSPVQAQTPFLIAAPHISPELFDQPTSHLDIVPTLLDVLGCKVDDPTCLHGRSMFHPVFDDTAQSIVIGESRGDAWVVIERANRDDNQQASYRFACDPFVAKFRLEGTTEPQGWSAQPDSSDDDFVPVFQRLTDQLCAGAAPQIPDDAYPALLASLGNHELGVRHLAIESLAEMNQVAAETIPILRRLLEDKEPSIRLAAAAALAKLKRSK